MGGFLLKATHVIVQPYQLQATGQVGCFWEKRRRGDPLVVVKVGKIQRSCQIGAAAENPPNSILLYQELSSPI